MKTFKNLLMLTVYTVLLLVSGCANNKSQIEAKNIVGKTAVITRNTFVFEQPNEISNNFQPLEKGNLIRIVSIKNNDWYYIEPVHLNYPTSEGYVNKRYLSFDLKNNIPNQGYISQENLYEKADSNSCILYKNMSGAISIFKRENGWANCSYPDGSDDVWIKEADIAYLVPDVLVK